MRHTRAFRPPGERRRLAGVLSTVCLALGVLAAAPGVASAATTICSGTPSAPGTLAGSYSGDVLVEGVCAVNSGPATVHGTVTVTRGSALIAAFGMNGSVLDVTRNIRVGPEASMLLGCIPSSFACIDEPSQSDPKLTSAPVVGGSIISRDPLGVVVHNATIGGGVSEVSGGGGMTCNPSGIFGVFGSPVYSDYEDSTVAGDFEISKLTSCWLGMARVSVGGNARFVSVNLADPDGIEIIANDISGNLVCRDNSRVWDSADLSSGLYPRLSEPNTVGGTRVGQCVLASPKDMGGPLGPGPF